MVLSKRARISCPTQCNALHWCAQQPLLVSYLAPTGTNTPISPQTPQQALSRGTQNMAPKLLEACPAARQASTACSAAPYTNQTAFQLCRQPSHAPATQSADLPPHAYAMQRDNRGRCESGVLNCCGPCCTPSKQKKINANALALGAALLEHVRERVLGHLVLRHVPAAAAARLHARAILASLRPLQRSSHLRP